MSTKATVTLNIAYPPDKCSQEFEDIMYYLGTFKLEGLPKSVEVLSN